MNILTVVNYSNIQILYNYFHVWPKMLCEENIFAIHDFVSNNQKMTTIATNLAFQIWFLHFISAPHYLLKVLKLISV
jgi:hypothetical protein